MLALFAANLSLILSILWCLCNALVYALPCCYAVKIWRLRKREVGILQHHAMMTILYSHMSVSSSEGVQPFQEVNAVHTQSQNWTT